VHEFDWQEHCDGQHDHKGKADGPIGFQREKDKHQHVPATGKAFERVICCFHARIAEIHRRGEGDHNDRNPARPAIHQPGFVKRECGDKDVGEVVDDQIQQLSVKDRGVGLRIILAGQRPVDPVHEKGDDKPKEHQAPLFVHSGQHREHRKNRARGGEKVNSKRFLGEGHGNVHRLIFGRGQ